MKKAALLSILVVVLQLAVEVIAEAQQSKKIPRIAYVVGRSAPMQFDEAFRQGLRELGYIEGQNIIIEYRWGEGMEGSLPNLFAEVMRRNPDLISTHSVRLE